MTICLVCAAPTHDLLVIEGHIHRIVVAVGTRCEVYSELPAMICSFQEVGDASSISSTSHYDLKVTGPGLRGVH